MSEPRRFNRTLRSPRLRALLWLAQDGKCALCGEELDGDWEADHIDPWRVSHRTNVHEMQATHRRCNRVKGVSSGAELGRTPPGPTGCHRHNP